MINVVFVVALLIIALVDWKTHNIYNWMVIPTALYGCLHTGNWAWAAVIFLGLAPFYYDKEVNPQGVWHIGGGDIKLFAMVGAFLGIKAIPVIVFTYISLQVYRGIKYRFYEPIPVAPFVFFLSLCFLW